MKMTLFILLTAFAGQTALASHPHDRVCVSSSPVAFVFQYSIGRTYEKGDPNQDPHKVAGEASYSPGDYMDLPSEKYTSEASVLQPKGSRMIPMTLKSSKGEIFFKGTFDLSTETLQGAFSAEGKTVQANTKLSCISQPRFTLESSQNDIVQ